MTPPGLHANSRLCLATVTTERYMPGTLVTLHSFLRHNPWFDGDLVVIHNQLDRDLLKILEVCFDQVRFLQVSEALRSRVQNLVACHPDLSARQARFYSLESFRLQGYEQVLFCDSDVLFRQSIEDLFALSQPLICCGDGPHYQGYGRHSSSFQPMPTSDATSNANGVRCSRRESP